MPESVQLPHLQINGYKTDEPYRYPRLVNIQSRLVERDRAAHGARILNQLNNIKARFEELQAVQLPQNVERDEAIYVEFVSEWSYPLKFESLYDSRENYQLLKISNEVIENQERYRVLVMLKKGGISHFIKAVEKYLDESRDRIKIDENGNETRRTPSNNALLANVELIQLASLEAFWSDAPEKPFPNVEQEVWWEVWFRKTSNDDEKMLKVLNNLNSIGAQITNSDIIFPEHTIRLIKASAIQLSRSLMLLDNLSELRSPQELPEFITDEEITTQDKETWLQDLINRTDNRISETPVVICLVDTGVNNRHPLLSPFLPDDRLFTLKDGWGKYDSWSGGGHGTGMASLAVYGDLTEALASPERIQIFHGLESFKLIQRDVINEPELYGSITKSACYTPASSNPQNPRVYCMAICDPDFAFKGRPSSWSAAIDKIIVGEPNNQLDPPQIFVVSGGNVHIEGHNEYPSKNEIESIHDPGQSYNAITVGSYTRKERLSAEEQNNGFSALAPYGAMSPSSSTSLFWDSQWPNKPDVVMEGGNRATNGTFTFLSNNLRLLSTHNNGAKIFQSFGDTSGAAALASKMAAEIMTKYPNLWPETIRGLMIHSADWTSAMLGNGRVEQFTEPRKRALLRTVGYGVPVLSKALYSASNSLTIIAEREIQPFLQNNNNDPKYNEYHLFKLPWPVEVLRDVLYTNDVKLTVTLSYYIEPNPGNRRYSNSFQYHSHALDFIAIKPNESLDIFKRRISSASEQEEMEESIDTSGEPWVLKRLRNKGSIKKDFIVMSGADLSTRNIIAVFPKNGWYKTRKKLGKANTKVRYSLIVSLETPRTEVDIYTPVQTQISIENIVEIPINV
ncbi:S8 family peptidase [Solitalea lacus]|uniref:S8 family peptidase n=1 Tax=Solitalea lacus TaxID=2911172 RepID=UPI001EDC4062|nr:S8 family peptidase [Solitalea lacus]UKJ07783.1 S8 family peptidase [Solitalea lacus]